MENEESIVINMCGNVKKWSSLLTDILLKPVCTLLPLTPKKIQLLRPNIFFFMPCWFSKSNVEVQRSKLRWEQTCNLQISFYAEPARRHKYTSESSTLHRYSRKSRQRVGNNNMITTTTAGGWSNRKLVARGDPQMVSEFLPNCFAPDTFPRNTEAESIVQMHTATRSSNPR